MRNKTRSYGTVVVGGGQAGLATGYYLQQQGLDFVILDAGERIGDSWRARWDSLRLFTQARYSSLPGMPFPASRHYLPQKDEMADYLEAYAGHFNLPVELGVWIESLTREGERFVLRAGERLYEARNVVVATSSFQVPKVPSFANELDPGIIQLHSADYRNPDQLQDGGVLIVGAGNSGAEIGLDVAGKHPTWVSGRDVGHLPFHIDTPIAEYLLVPFVLRILFHRVLTVNTPIGRKMAPKLLREGMMLVRVKPEDLDAAGVERVPRTVGVQGGLPVFEDGRILDVANVIWCTGFRPNFSWIDLPIFGDEEHPIEPQHERGVVRDVLGLYFVGLFFLYALSSALISGVGRDAAYIVDKIAARSAETTAAGQAQPRPRGDMAAA